MVRRDGAEIRKERMEEIARIIQRSLSNESELIFSKTVSTLAYKFGLKPERISEYLEILDDLGQFVLDKEHDLIKKLKADSNE
jgi:hypothetical protein